jgi:hypothetical protein
MGENQFRCELGNHDAARAGYAQARIRMIVVE